MSSPSPISNFMEQEFLHFNARETLAAAKAYKSHIESGGKMLVSLGGAMSTAELGISLAEMIRQDKVHAISCTGANLEEDVFNLVAHDEYRLVPEYRDLSPQGELELLEQGFNRVTDTCIPETVMRHIEGNFMQICAENAENGVSLFPYEVFYRLFETGVLEPTFRFLRKTRGYWPHSRRGSRSTLLGLRIRHLETYLQPE